MNSSPYQNAQGYEYKGLASLQEAAQKIGVSTATVRNWVRAGYLQSEKRGFITEESLREVLEQILKIGKLQSRANKSQKDDHDHQALREKYAGDLQGQDAEILGAAYEQSLSESYRNREGIYYTPDALVQDLLTSDDLVLEGDKTLKTVRFCDPCCGSGNFLLRALELGVLPENVYGFDCDPVAISIARARVRAFCGEEAKHLPHLEQRDFLEQVIQEKAEQGQQRTHFDIIYTNPPWGKKLPEKERAFVAQSLGVKGGRDTCALFLEACLESLCDGGRLGLLLPESFFHIGAFEAARQRVLGQKLERLIDYGQAFRGLLTKAQALILTKKTDLEETYQAPDNKVHCEHSGQVIVRSQRAFSCNPKSILNFSCDQQTVETLEYLWALPFITLKGCVDWGLGIVTGNNKKWLKTKAQPGYIPVLKGADLSLTGIQEPSHYLPEPLSQYQQVAPMHLFQAPEKLIYKFISSRLCFVYDCEQRFVLNSANMLIPNEQCPVSAWFLKDLLNSHLMNWMFTHLFHTRKILKGDLECLPIYLFALTGMEEFDESLYLERLGIMRHEKGGYCRRKEGA